MKANISDEKYISKKVPEVKVKPGHTQTEKKPFYQRLIKIKKTSAFKLSHQVDVVSRFIFPVGYILFVVVYVMYYIYVHEANRDDI